MTVDIFIPCYIDQLFPQTGYNMVKVLEKVGLQVRYNGNQTCCGKVAYDSGYWDHAKAIGDKFIRDFADAKLVVAPSASCVSMVKGRYDELYYNSGFHNEYRQLQKVIYEFSDFMVNFLKIKDTGAVFPHVVTYHHSCAALREYGLKDEPRELLSYVRGLKLVEMEETDVCCGFGGVFAMKNEGISQSMAARKVENALSTGATYIVSADATCLMHMQAYITKNDLPLKTIHLVDVLASGWEE